MYFNKTIVGFLLLKMRFNIFQCQILSLLVICWIAFTIMILYAFPIESKMTS